MIKTNEKLEQIERRRKKVRECHQRLRSTPEGRAKLKAIRKRYLEKNKEKIAKRRREIYEQDRERQIAGGTERNKRNPRRRDILNKSYRKSLTHSVAEFRRGNLGVAELSRRVDEALIRSAKVIERFRAERDSWGMSDSEEHQREPETKARDGKDGA